MKMNAGLLLLTVILGGATSVAAAQPAGGPPPVAAHGPGMRHDPAERLAALHDRLGITPAQSAAWGAYAKVLSDLAARHQATHRRNERLRFLEMSTPERLALLQQRRSAREQDRAALINAADALLPVLTDTQKVRAYMMLPGLARHGHGPGAFH
jgi:periplasmic protein CpxP/Spy